MLEIEAKLRVPDLDATRSRLEKVGARRLGRYVESNTILDRADHSLRRGGCGLRVRSMRTLEGETAAATVTFKGPVQPGAVKRREEIETEIADADAMLSMLAALGYETVLSFRKRRERWVMKDCHVELDDVPLLGTFVEIEGPSESAIRSVQKSLGLGREKHVTKGYVGLLADRCREIGRSTVGIDFEQ